MSEADASRRSLLEAKITTPESIRRQLLELSHLEEKGRHGIVKKARYQLMFHVLSEIAEGRVKDPGQAAAALLAGLGDETLLSARKRQAQPTRPAASTVNGSPKTEVFTKRELLEKAERAANDVVIAEDALDFLYKHSRHRDIPRKEWAHRVRVACAIDNVLRTDFKSASLESYERLVDEKETLNIAGSTLLLTSHMGFVIIARRLFAQVLKDEHIFGRGGTISTKGRERDALFIALRALQDGRVMMVAPDGPDGRQAPSLHVFGKNASAGDGAAYIAFASGCNTAWYTVVRQGDRFVPVVQAGPVKSAGETFEQFRDRLYAFYSNRIEDLYSGDPDNIVLRPMWYSLFCEGRASRLRARAASLMGIRS